jgi:hypothetical protein
MMLPCKARRDTMFLTFFFPRHLPLFFCIPAALCTLFHHRPAPFTGRPSRPDALRCCLSRPRASLNTVACCSAARKACRLPPFEGFLPQHNAANHWLKDAGASRTGDKRCVKLFAVAIGNVTPGARIVPASFLNAQNGAGRGMRNCFRKNAKNAERETPLFPSLRSSRFPFRRYPMQATSSLPENRKNTANRLSPLCGPAAPAHVLSFENEKRRAVEIARLQVQEIPARRQSRSIQIS